jgi:predicted RNase H-like nuclease (RuvC/YqgF family)
MNDQEREQARDQLEAATVRTYQQMRTDQERIAELELELADTRREISALVRASYIDR